MNIITTQADLEAFCTHAKTQDFLCVDTEFMRESTYYSILCLIQAATAEQDVIIDPLADGLDLAPFLGVLEDTSVTKVMHAARQDIEIFYHMNKTLPRPLFDTQVAGMALGFGDSVGYGALVKGRLDRNLDKGARFTDWSRRPLSDKQLNYALGDVTHLRDMYPGIREELTTRKRLAWVEEETEPLLDPALYKIDPESAWERLKIRNPKRDYLAVLKAAAAWRERSAVNRNVPRRRILKDDALYNIAQQKPQDLKALGRLRGVPNGFERSKGAQDLVDSINAALANAEDYAPHIPKPVNMPPNLGPSVDMLRTLLKLKCEYDDIAPRLVASQKDIELLAAFGEDAHVPALKGWRREVFGNAALDMLAGKIVLRLHNGEVVAEEM